MEGKSPSLDPNMGVLLSKLRECRPNKRRKGPTMSSEDQIIQATDGDASVARHSAVRKGYLVDDYTRFFVEGDAVELRRLPIINRGTYARTIAIDNLIERWLKENPHKPKQIISLGAGSDTRYFRLRHRYPNIKLIYHEFDFPENTRKKLSILRRHPSPLDFVGSFESITQEHHGHPSTQGIIFNIDSLYSPAGGLNIHPLDLRSLLYQDPPPPEFKYLDPTIPTLILSEMCLCYLTTNESNAIMNLLLSRYLSPSTPAAFILYEPIRPHDSFGRVMTANFSKRDINMPTLNSFPTLVSQKQRLRDVGFMAGQGAADIDFIFKTWVKGSERVRLNQECEQLDEEEEWVLLARHYCVAWGWRDGEISEEVETEMEIDRIIDEEERERRRQVEVARRMATNVFSRCWSCVVGDEKDDSMNMMPRDVNRFGSGPGLGHGAERLRDPLADD